MKSFHKVKKPVPSMLKDKHCFKPKRQKQKQKIQTSKQGNNKKHRFWSLQSFSFKTSLSLKLFSSIINLPTDSVAAGSFSVSFI